MPDLFVFLVCLDRLVLDSCAKFNALTPEFTEESGKTFPKAIGPVMIRVGKPRKFFFYVRSTMRSTALP
jgi:hypothetical protein